MNVNKNRRRGFRHNLFFALLMLFPFHIFAAEFDESIDPYTDNVTTSLMYLKSATGYMDAPLLDSSVDIAISGVVSKITLTQSFNNTSTEWVEGLYVFPLPDQAAVNSLVIRIGDREIVGSVKEKKQAEKQYELAKEAGHVASLVKQHRPNMFSSRFANVPPGETITVELGYVQTVRYENDKYSLRIPLTITPRYSNSLVIDSAAISPPQVNRINTDQHDRIDHRVEISASLLGQYDESQISSPSHQFATAPLHNGTQIILSEQAYLDRDFILQWHEAESTVPAVQLWRETLNGEDYLLATVMPPRDNEIIPDQPRELVLIIDTSGSMGGTSIVAAKAALIDALSGLQPQDAFNIIEFNSTYQALFDKPVAASASNVKQAIRFTEGLAAGGGTEMLGALRTALRYEDSGILRQVVFITDGSVGYEDTVLQSIKGYLGNSRIFTVGIGSAPNEWFMRKVAEAGRGTFTFISNIADVQTEMSGLMKKIESPALTNIAVSFDGGTAEVVPEPIPDLYASEPVVIAAKISDTAHTMNINGTWGPQEWGTSVSIQDAPLTNTGLSSVWAKQKIESLQDKQRYNADPDFYRSLILRLALDHQLLSPYTAFLAIEAEPIRPTNEALVEKKVPNLMPAGSSMQSMSYPQGSAGTDTLLLLSIVLTLIALFITYGHRLQPRSEPYT